MKGDPRTAGGAPPPEVVTLVRKPSGIPLQPRMASPEDYGHKGLGTASEIARNPELGVRKADPSAVPAEESDLGASIRTVFGVGGGNVLDHGDQFSAYVNSLPKGEQEALFTDPRANDPAFVAEILQSARAPQPKAQTVEGIEAFMRANRAAYNKDERLQARYLGLLEERERAKGQ